MHFNKEKSLFVKYLMLAGMMLVLSRTVSSFSPQLSRLSTQKRRCYYNSQWTSRQPSSALIIPTLKRAAEPQEEGNPSGSTTSAAGQEEDPLAQYRNKNNVNDQVVSFISKQGGIKVG
jgi:hypothetical protein